MSEHTQRGAAAAVMACALLTVTTSAAVAAPQGYDEEERNAGRFYGSFEKDVLLFTGDGAEAWCMGDEPTRTARVYDRSDGSVDVKVNVRDMPFVLYRTPLDAPLFLEATCEALDDDDPTTVPVQPFASGTAGYKERVSISPDGVEGTYNGVNGIAVGTNGTRWKVRTWADLVVDDGVPLGDPAEFQGLSIQQIGP